MLEERFYNLRFHSFEVGFGQDYNDFPNIDRVYRFHSFEVGFGPV